ncbi:hypothetical protein [Glycocaulis sp.]|uniref:hypothetical protein n=1 Tax=Glycocaulis sp. TaxID=1969725 RepID=UPI003F7063D8
MLRVVIFGCAIIGAVLALPCGHALTQQQGGSQPLQTVRPLPAMTARPAEAETEQDQPQARETLQGPATLTTRPEPMQGLAGRPAAQQGQPGMTAQQAGIPALAFDSSQASMAALNADAVRAAVGRSPLFLAELDYRGLSNAQSLPLLVAPGAEIDLPRYLRETDLSAQPDVAAIIANPRALGVTRPLVQRNEVFLLEDRLIVSRQVTVTVERDSCERAARTAEQRAFQESFCLTFVPAGQRTDFARVRPDALRRGLNPDDLLGTPPTEADIREAAEAIREELRAMNPRALYAFDVTVEAALRLSDDALLALELNGEEREITHVTVIPLDESLRMPADIRREPGAAPPARIDQGLLMDQPIGPSVRVFPELFRSHVITRADLMRVTRPVTASRLPQSALQGAAGSHTSAPADSGYQVFSMPQQTTLRHRLPDFDARDAVVTESEDFYFLTGFTISRSIEDRYKHTFNRRKNYFVAFQYSVGFGLGLRFPFEVRAVTTERFNEILPDVWHSQSLNLQLSARGVSGAERVPGVPSVYLASGLDPSLRFDDQEFVFRLWAGCQLQVRAPVVGTVRINCPSVNIPRAGTCPGWACQRFTPLIAGGRTELARFTVPASVSGLRINAWIGEAGLEPGVRVEARNANLRFNLAANGAPFATQGSRACAAPGRGSPTASNRLVNGQTCEVRFIRAGHGSGEQMQFHLQAEGGRDPSLTLSDPVYSFTMALVPFIDLYGAIDIAVARWELRHTFDIPGLTIQQDFTFPRHEGTQRSVTLGTCSPGAANGPQCANARVQIQPRSGGPG